MPWSRAFDDAIKPPKGKPLVTLKDAAAYIMALPKSKQQSQGMARGPLMPAHIGMLRALNHGNRSYAEGAKSVIEHRAYWGLRWQTMDFVGTIRGSSRMRAFMAAKAKTTVAPCSKCLRKTTHRVLFERKGEDEHYGMIECGGCGAISMMVTDAYFTGELTYYPSAVSRKMPRWLGLMLLYLPSPELTIGSLMHEVYQAVASGQNRLAAMGIRAALEQVMILKVGDLRSFDAKLDAFQQAGYISLLQRDAMRATLDVGDAVMHRGHEPTEEDLNLALDIVEGVLAPIFGHEEEARKLADRVPKRKRSP